MENANYVFQSFSRATEYEYTIQLYVPEEEPPEEGFPIIYVLDGQSYFELAKSVVKLQSQNTVKTKIESSIVVGVCHHKKDTKQRRFLDFTAPAEQYIFPKRMEEKKMNFGKNGGASLFHQYMEYELKPYIEKQFPVNKKKQTLYGHSLAGYYTIWCYLTHCADFQYYLAISPSVWWNGKELYQYLEKADRQHLQNLYIAVGEHEGFMVEDARTFYNKLSVDSKELYIALGENHASVVPTTMSQSFRFIFNNERNNQNVCL